MPETHADERELPPINVTPIWARLNDDLIRLVDYVPDDRLDWSPKPGFWSIREILPHIAAGRDTWLSRNVKDGLDVPEVLVWTRAEIREAYLRTWKRLEAYLLGDEKLNAIYTTRRGLRSGHWIAFHLLEHDIHHRADVLHYLALLDIPTPDVGTP